MTLSNLQLNTLKLLDRDWPLDGIHPKLTSHITIPLILHFIRSSMYCALFLSVNNKSCRIKSPKLQIQWSFSFKFLWSTFPRCHTHNGHLLAYNKKKCWNGCVAKVLIKLSFSPILIELQWAALCKIGGILVGVTFRVTIIYAEHALAVSSVAITCLLQTNFNEFSPPKLLFPFLLLEMQASHPWQDQKEPCIYFISNKKTQVNEKTQVVHAWHTKISGHCWLYET